MNAPGYDLINDDIQAVRGVGPVTLCFFKSGIMG
jgi:hypothetical protein